MPRPPRLLLSQSFYHIMTRGNNKKVVFKNASDYFYYLELIKKYKEILPFDLYHYCLMPNHVHLLIQTKKARDFSDFMKRLNLAYFHHFNQAYGWTGHFWQDRFKSQPVGKDEYFIQCGKYIELNPVRKGLVAKPKDYPYSSYAYYFHGRKSDLLTEDIFYQSLGKTPNKRQKLYSQLIIDEAVEKNYQQRIWGSKTQYHNELQKIKNHGKL